MVMSIATIASGEDLTQARREFAKSVLAREHGKNQEAAQHLETARLAHPTSIILVNRVALILVASDDIKGASTLYRELAAARPDSLRAQFLYADFLRESSHDDDFSLDLAATTLEKALLRFPLDQQVMERLFRIYEQRRQREKSLALYQSYLASPAANPQLAETFARTLFPSDDKQVLADLDRLYKLQMDVTPADPILARAASEHFRKSKRLPDAIRILQQHTTAAPASLELRVRTGILQLANEQAADGEKTLLDVLAIAPENLLAHQSLAKLYTKQNKIDQALIHRADALKIGGGEASDFQKLADEWMNEGENKRARILLEKSCYYYPKDQQLAWQLAVATHRDPETAAKALELFRKAEAMNPEPIKNPDYLSEAAAAFWLAKDTVRAETMLRQAIKLYPATEKKESATAMRRLASWWQEQGKNEQAARALIQRANMLDK